MSDRFKPDSPDFLSIHDDRIALIAESYLRLTGQRLVPESGDVIEKLWSLPQVILAHGTEKDPLFFYGNRAALELFELTPEELVAMPSRLSAEPLLREERSRLLERVNRHGFIDDYAGIRVSSGGRRFQISNATVWNLIDERGSIHGQAATFSDWVYIA
jgi:PAS domain-containing protein